MTYGIRAPGFRLPAETEVGAVCLQVTDLEQSIEFYHGLLGFSVVDQTGERVLLGVGGKALVELHPGARTSQTGRRLGLYHFAILLPDRAALGVFLQRLLDTGTRPGAADHLVSEALYIQDPDGLGIEVYCDRPRAEWHVRAGQLAMASEPLDFEGILRAGAGAEWVGMPSATRMGHIHLHVGDIDEAKAFYHAGLGFDVVVWNYPGALFMSAGGYHHHLGVNTWAGPRADRAAPDEARLLWWDLQLPSRESLERAAESLVDHGYSVTAEAVGVASVLDPWGTALRLKATV